MALAREAGLAELVDAAVKRLADKGSMTGLKLSSLVAGMEAGADSVDDTELLRHRATSKLFPTCYAPSTLSSHPRTFTLGHVKQLKCAANHFQENLGLPVPLPGKTEFEDVVFVDIGKHHSRSRGYQNQGA